MTLALGFVLLASNAMATCFTFKEGREPSVVIIKDIITEQVKEVCLEVEGHFSRMTVDTVSGRVFDVEGKLRNSRDLKTYSFTASSGNAAISGIDLTMTRGIEGGKPVYNAKIKQNATLAGEATVQAMAVRQ